MSRRVIVGSLVVVAVALVLWLKPRTSTNGTPEVPDPALAPAATQVLPFADPSEAESSCGCGQILDDFDKTRPTNAADGPRPRKDRPDAEQRLTARSGSSAN